MNSEGKQKAYEEMCALMDKEGKQLDGKFHMSFDEIADIVSRNMGIQQKDVITILESEAKKREF